ncbi:MAG TPA: caspase family protein [Kofleriaceae bacterium]|jgi:hypothetical protein
MTDGKIHCVFIGIDEYSDSAIPRLDCAVRDAQAMADLFEGVGAEVTLVLDSRATLVTLRRALWALTRTVSTNDTAIVYFAGHGASVSLPRRNSPPRTVPCLMPYDSQHDDLLATGISMEELGECFASILSKRVIFLFDSCYSGAVANCRSFVVAGARAPITEQPILPRIAGEGMIVLAASSEYQPAFEDKDRGHGIFTGALIEAFSGKVTPDEEMGISLAAVQKHLETHVPARSQEKFKHRQVPTQLGTFNERFVFPIMRSTRFRSLAGFPTQFLPLTVVIGDRREAPPKAPGDLLALSASPAELRWLPGLRLPHDTEIVSDKVFAQLPESELRQQFGNRNLLVVGSPAANLLARTINAHAFFPFAITRQAAEWHRTTTSEIKKNTSRPALANFARDVQTPETHRFYMNLFRKGFIDPTYSFLSRGDRIPPDRDYGTVTLARNPFSDPTKADFVAILAAGVSLPGTMHSITLLREAQRHFAERPLGGIFSVILAEREYPERVTEATVEWSTSGYDTDQVRRGLQNLKTREDTTNELTFAEIDQLLDLLDLIVRHRL